MKKLGLAVIAVALASPFAVCARAGQDSAPEIARQLVREVYAGVDGGDTKVRLATGSYLLSQPWGWHELSLLLTEYDPTRSDRTAEVLAASVSFDLNGHVMALRASGPFVKTEDVNRARTEVDRHPEWPDARVLRFLREAGAHFTPDQVGERLLGKRIAPLGPFLGSTTVQSCNFEVRDDPALPPIHARLEWFCEVDVASSPVRPSHYFVWLEPFEGRIVSVSSNEH
jgi:hypothetical protein